MNPASAIRRFLPCLGAVLALILVVASCARQGFPPGGPEDKIPPVVDETVPANGAVNVAGDAQVVFDFSEPVDEKSVEDNLFIVPIPTEWPEVRWRSGGRTAALVFASGLRTNSTYVITVGSKARDRQGNQMKDSYTLMFSTGSRVESGVIRGKVIPSRPFSSSPESPAGIDVIAYRLNDSSDPDPRVDVPDYATQTGSDGAYALTGLSSARYRLFAVGDRDRNGFYTEGEDMIGIASGDVALADGDSIAFAPDIMVAAVDTSLVRFASAKPVDKNRVEVFFDREIVPGSFNIAFDGLDIAGWFVSDGEPKKASVATSDQTVGRTYGITKLAAEDRFGNRLGPPSGAMEFAGTARADTSALEIVDKSPKVMTPGHEPLVLTFNRALAAFDSGMVIADASGERLSVSRKGANVLEIFPADSWRENTNYLFTFDREALKGAGGGRLEGPGAQVAFRVVHSDTLGFMSGTIVDSTGTEGGRYRIRLRHLETEAVKTLDVKGRAEWQSGPVLPGRYVAFGFRDDDGDGEPCLGKVKPRRPAEPVYAVPDTIAVVSRRTSDKVRFIFR